MLSQTSRYLTYLIALLYLALGAWLFLLPNQAAPVFAWKISPFIAMTIGGWCLGNAWNAYITARRWTWAKVYLSLIYLWLFGLGQLAVVIAFQDKLALAHPVAWLYMAALGVNVLAAIMGIVDWLRIRPAFASKEKLRPSQVTLVAIFVLFVSFLGVYGLTVAIGAPGTSGGIFPEPMSAFTLRSFAAFYLSIGLATIFFLFTRDQRALLNYGFSQYGLIIFITAAALFYLPLFDFAARPGGLLYFGAYLVVGVILIDQFRRLGTGAD